MINDLLGEVRALVDNICVTGVMVWWWMGMTGAHMEALWNAVHSLLSLSRCAALSTLLLPKTGQKAVCFSVIPIVCDCDCAVVMWAGFAGMSKPNETKSIDKNIFWSIAFSCLDERSTPHAKDIYSFPSSPWRLPSRKQQCCEHPHCCTHWTVWVASALMHFELWTRWGFLIRGQKCWDAESLMIACCVHSRLRSRSELWPSLGLKRTTRQSTIIILSALQRWAHIAPSQRCRIFWYMHSFNLSFANMARLTNDIIIESWW